MSPHFSLPFPVPALLSPFPCPSSPPSLLSPRSSPCLAYPGLWGLSEEEFALNPADVPADPASVYRDDSPFLSALGSAEVTMYSYGAPRTGSPAFSKVLRPSERISILLLLSSLRLQLFTDRFHFYFITHCCVTACSILRFVSFNLLPLNHTSAQLLSINAVPPHPHCCY